jgi:hypothetical protein
VLFVRYQQKKWQRLISALLVLYGWLHVKLGFFLFLFFPVALLIWKIWQIRPNQGFNIAWSDGGDFIMIVVALILTVIEIAAVSISLALCGSKFGGQSGTQYHVVNNQLYDGRNYGAVSPPRRR